jgi:hypothetical protein
MYGHIGVFRTIKVAIVADKEDFLQEKIRGQEWLNIYLTLKNALFWAIKPPGYSENRRFGGMCRPHQQDETNQQLKNSVSNNYQLVGSHKGHRASYPRRWHSS